MNISPGASLTKVSWLLAKLEVVKKNLFNPKMLWLGHASHHGMADMYKDVHGHRFCVSVCVRYRSKNNWGDCVAPPIAGA